MLTTMVGPLLAGSSQRPRDAVSSCLKQDRTYAKVGQLMGGPRARKPVPMCKVPLAEMYGTRIETGCFKSGFESPNDA